MEKRKDYTGKKFGKLEIVQRAPDKINKQGEKYKYWKCRCECGRNDNFLAYESNLILGKTWQCNICRNEQRSQSLKKINKYILDNNYGIGITHNTNNEFYFDIEDFEKIKDYCWHKGKYGYAETTIRIEKGQTILKMHRLIMDAKEDEEVDHIYHHNADNRKSKLRKCSHFENMHNKKLNFKNKTGIPGVVKTKYGKFNAQVAYGENINLGIFDTIEEARDARLKYKEENGIFISNADRGIPD